MISTLMTAVNTIAWLQAILEEKKVEAVEPVEGVETEVAEEGLRKGPLKSSWKRLVSLRRLEEGGCMVTLRLIMLGG